MEARKGKYPSNSFQFLTQTLKITLLGVIVLSSVFALNHINLSAYFPIRTVKIYGLNRLDQNEVQNVLSPLVNHGFFTINVESIRDSMAQMPWISDIYVRRIWPDRVEVTLVEKKPAAQWNDTTLLSHAGELFSPKPTSFPSDLPRFSGPAGQQIVMLNYFKDINRLLSPLHAKISYLELTPFMTWKVALDNGLVLQAGHKDVLTRLGQFVKVYPKIVGARATDVDYVDLRYPNGVAVRWKT